MANYHKRNSIRAVQWDPENAQSFKDIKKQTDYQEELKKRHLDRSDEETIPSSYYIDTTEAAIYECQDYAPNWLTVSVLYAINEVV